MGKKNKEVVAGPGVRFMVCKMWSLSLVVGISLLHVALADGVTNTPAASESPSERSAMSDVTACADSRVVEPSPGCQTGGCERVARDAAASSRTNAVETVEKKPEGNPNIERLLRERDLNFSIDDEGDFRLGFEFEGGRSQVAFIKGGINNYNDYETIQVFSLGYRGRLMKPMAIDLLSRQHKIGFWHVEKSEATGKFCVAFFAQLPVDIMARDLETCVRCVAETADALECEWTDVDEL